MSKEISIPTFKFATLEDLKDRQNDPTFNKSLFVPTLGDPDSTGFDVRCATPGGAVLSPGEYFLIPLGFRMFAPKGWWLYLVPRSSSFYKKQLNGLYGVIDETYERELAFVGQYLPGRSKLLSSEELIIPFGERIAQVIPMQRPIINMEEVSNEELEASYLERNASRGTGGFGSTGK